MGSAKHAMMEAEERGWWDVDEYVCSNCVDEPFLQTLINRSGKSSWVCSYCGATHALAVNDLMPNIMFAIGSHYNEPNDSGMGLEYMKEEFECTSTEEVLYNLGIEGSAKLIDTLVVSVDNDCWADAPGGSFMGSHKHEYWMYSWQNFCQLVKHKNRYFFHFVEGHDFDSEDMSPGAVLFKLQEAVAKLGLFKKEPAFSRRLFRARIKDDSWDISAAQLRQPPNEYASAGRMNPAGISFFYAAEDAETAVKEVCKSVAEVAIGEFEICVERTFLDLTELPELPSLFDMENNENRQYILFLKGFIEDITKLISKDGKEHIDYVPTQIVSELFANQVKADDQPIDGIRFFSSVNPGGINWVMFPRAFDKVSYNSAKLVTTELVIK